MCWIVRDWGMQGLLIYDFRCRAPEVEADDGAAGLSNRCMAGARGLLRARARGRNFPGASPVWYSRPLAREGITAHKGALDIHKEALECESPCWCSGGLWHLRRSRWQVRER